LRRDAPRLRYPGRRHRRHLLRVARAPGLERADASSGYPGLANGDVHPNGILFMLIGLQLPQVIHALAPGAAIEVAKLALLVLLVLVLVRFACMFGATYLPRLFSKTFRRKNPAPWQQTALIAWIGMRGADSLAAALAIPFLLPNGTTFPGRDLILLLTFCVIFGTLVVQGLTLRPLVGRLGIVDDHVADKEERLARLKANEAALARVEELGSSNEARPASVERLRSEYADRIRE